MGSDAFVSVQEIALAVKTVPPEFVVTDEVRETLGRRAAAGEGLDDGLRIPLIDLRPLFEDTAEESERVKREIGRACEDLGFFQVINHGIRPPMLEKAMEVVEGFFDLPREEKQEYCIKPGKHEGYGLVTKPRIRSWGDTFRHVVRPEPSPDQDVQPKTPAAYKEVMREYAGEVAKLGRRLTGALSEYLGLEPTALQTALTTEGSDDFPGVTFALNFYPPCPEPDRVLGIFPHSDGGAMTILHQNHVEGLQVLKGGKWLTVKAVENCLVVNISDQLKILTNNRLKSVKHRAIANSTAKRVSIAAFLNPGSMGVVVGPLPQFVDENRPALYPPMQYSDYLTRLFSGGFENATDLTPGDSFGFGLLHMPVC